MLESPKFYTDVYQVHELEPSWRNEMLNLYKIYYADCADSKFFSDLDEKDYVIILRNLSNNICGFSTLKSIKTSFLNKPIRVIFSGDTIIHHKYWGMQDPSLFFLRISGHIWKQNSIPLYWLLITKGHRTYRYLNIFTREYYPNFQKKTPEWIQNFTHFLAQQQFGSAYNNSTGVLHFDSPQGRLKEKWTDISSRHSHLPEVSFFLESNPGYVHGDELVCLAELSPENLKPRAQRIFLRGLDEDNAKNS